MSHYHYDDQHGAEFKAWREELYADEVAGVKRHELIRPALRHRPDGIQELSASHPLEVPVDAYGLPARFTDGLPTPEEELELRWDAALLEFPFAEPGNKSQQLPWFSIMSQRSAMLAHGESYRGCDTEGYIQSWKDAGFSPELYCLLHSMIWVAVERVRPRERSAQDSRRWFAARLRELHLETGQLGLRGDNLQAEHWADLPALVSRLKISEALERIIRRGRQV